MAFPPPKPPGTMSTGEKLAVGGFGLAVLGGLFAALGAGGKKPAPKPGLGKPCGTCGR